MKLAFADCRRHLADPARMTVSPELELLAPERLAALASQIEREQAGPRAGPTPEPGTVYAALADRGGTLVSLIQSNYLGFGSGVVVPGTGIALHNRGIGFSLAPGHPNVVAGGMRPYHTIMPGLLVRPDGQRMSFGVMGGHMQPQGHVQLVLRVLVFGQNPQAACDAPRWYVAPDGRVGLEPELAAAASASLAARGHELLADAPTTLFGGAQAIHQLDGCYCAGSDPRKDGQAVGS
jgi:gamma-glutamyltranspeptidase/glutathione hydrolase